MAAAVEEPVVNSLINFKNNGLAYKVPVKITGTDSSNIAVEITGKYATYNCLYQVSDIDKIVDNL